MASDTAAFFVLLGLTIFGSVLAPDGARKYVLLTSSAIFYGCAGSVNGGIILALIVANYVFANGLQTAKEDIYRTRLYYTAIAMNVSFFFAFKLQLEPLPGSSRAVWHVFNLEVSYPLGLSFIILMLHGALTDIYA